MPSEQPAADLIMLGENLELLGSFADASFQLIYIDPPFNTGRERERSVMRAVRDESASRRGFAGRTYRTELLARSSYSDSFEDYLAFLGPRLQEARRLLAKSGTLYLHV